MSGWRAQEVCTHLGTWDDAHPLDRLLASARAGGDGEPPDTDADNTAVIASHREDPPEAVHGALAAARAAVTEFLDSPDCEELALAPASSVLGPLPVLSVV